MKLHSRLVAFAFCLAALPALALAITPGNAAILIRVSHTDASKVLLGLSSFLLLLSIGAFGMITYSRPFRLRHEKKIDRQLNRDLPKIP